MGDRGPPGRPGVDGSKVTSCENEIFSILAFFSNESLLEFTRLIHGA